MVLSCFRPVASVIPGSFGRFVLPRESIFSPAFSPATPPSVIPSFSLVSFRFLPSFLPSCPPSSFAFAIFLPRPAPARICYWRRCTAEYLRALWMHVSRGKLNSFYLFIRAVVGSASLLSSSLYLCPSPLALTFHPHRPLLLLFSSFVLARSLTPHRSAMKIHGERCCWGKERGERRIAQARGNRRRGDSIPTLFFGKSCTPYPPAVVGRFARQRRPFKQLARTTRPK